MAPGQSPAEPEERPHSARSKIAFRRPAEPSTKTHRGTAPILRGATPSNPHEVTITPPTMHGTYKRRITCNLRDDDHQQLKAAADAAGMRLAPFVRDAALAYLTDSFLVPPRLDDLLGRLIAEARRIGNNVNQVAAKVNSTGRANRAELARARDAALELEHVTAILRTVVHNLTSEP